MFDLNKNWKIDKEKPRLYRERKFDNNKLSLFAPWYVINQANANFAVIFNGRQMIVKKIPKNKDYFVDKDLGMFYIDPKYAKVYNRATVYFYDLQNANPFDPGILQELFEWANSQGIYKLRKSDKDHAIGLRHKDTSNLRDEMDRQKRETRKFMHAILEKIRSENDETVKRMKEEQGNPESGEYVIKNDKDAQFIIVRNLFDHGYIDGHQAGNLNHKLTLNKINTVDDLLHEIDTFTDVYVTKPIPFEVERLLDDFHTYKPRDIIEYIKQLSKIRGGISKLRTKAVINWFPSMYILFGCLGVGIIIMLYYTYGQTVNPADFIPQP